MIDCLRMIVSETKDLIDENDTKECAENNFKFLKENYENFVQKIVDRYVNRLIKKKVNNKAVMITVINGKINIHAPNMNKEEINNLLTLSIIKNQ